jgi:mono/diheme cytochrome c family protein
MILQLKLNSHTAMRMSALALILFIAGCGGGGDSQTPPPVAQTPSPSPTPAPAAVDAVRGKALYATHCASCHAADPRANVRSVLLAANNPQAITDAINAARSGMRFLDAVLSAQDRADIAAYLANPV